MWAVAVVATTTIIIRNDSNYFFSPASAKCRIARVQVLGPKTIGIFFGEFLSMLTQYPIISPVAPPSPEPGESAEAILQKGGNSRPSFMIAQLHDF
jgi:hypothetical protein